MLKGKITVESGENKAVITMTDENGPMDVSIEFVPELDLTKTPNVSENFVGNIVSMFIEAMKGKDDELQNE